MKYTDGLATTLADAAVPYGYSLLVWTSGALAAQHHGTPHSHAVVAFAAGAAGAYTLLRLATRRGEVHATSGLAREGLLLAGAIHLVSLAAGILVAVYAGRIGGSTGWFLTPLLATAAYFVGTGFAETVQLTRR